MDRRHFGMLLGAAMFGLTLPLASADAEDDDHGNGHDHGHGDDDDQGKGHGHGHDHGHDHEENGHGKHGSGRYFREQDYGYLRQHYDGPRSLPPGLQKKYYRTGTLPPGWQKRFRPMPPVVLQQLPPVPAYYQRGYLDGYAVVIDPRTRVIVDAVDMVGALTGH